MEIETFVKVVDGGSLSSAARDLGVPRSTVSRHVQRLENRLGVRLLNRTTRKISLTEAGAEYYKRTSSIVANIREADEAVSQMDGVPRGLLRVSLTSVSADGEIAEILESFRTKYPEVTLEVYCSNRIVDLIAEGFDVAIHTGSPKSSSFIGKRVGAAQRVAVASPAYLDARGRAESPESLAHHDCLRYMIDTQPERSWPLLMGGSVRVDGPIAINDMNTLIDLAIAGQGIALVPILMIVEHVHCGHLEAVLPDQIGSKEILSLVYPTRQHLPLKTRTFIDHASERLKTALSRMEAELKCPHH